MAQAQIRTPEMPINASLEFGKAEQKYRNAKTLEDKIAAMHEVIAAAPKHKSSENLLRELRTRLKKLKLEAIDKKKKSGKRASIAIPKQGFQVVIIGFPNSGKSTLLTKLTNACPKIADYPFTTKTPEVGAMNYEGGCIQLVEIPALVKEAATKQAELMSFVQTADGIILLADDEHQRKTLMGELFKFKIDKPIFLASKDVFPDKKMVFEFFGLMRVYTKEPKDSPEKTRPIILKKSSTVLNAALKIHKDFARGLKYARVWGSTKFAGQRVDKEYVLKDGDVVEFHI